MAARKALRTRKRVTTRARAAASAASADAVETSAPGLELLAAVDVGSRALRLAVAEHVADRPLRRLESLAVPVAIGVDTFSRGRIRAVTTEAVVRTLNDFLQIAGGYGLKPEQVRAVATTAVRDARNREVFLERVEHGTGLRVAVLEAIEETRLVHQLVRHRMGPEFDEGGQLLLALGAGGTQFVVQADGEILLVETIALGQLQLLRGASERDALRRAASFLRKVIGPIGSAYELPPIAAMVVINSDLFRLVDGVGHADAREWGLQLTPEALAALSREVDGTADETLIQRTRLDRASVPLARLALRQLGVFAEMVGPVRRVCVPGSSMLDSLLLDMSRRRRPEARAGEHAAALVESAAWAIGHKYRVDEPHAAKVRELALQLFEGVRRMTTLADRSRVLLGVAAILHDAGVFVASADHELHSGYLIRASQIMGLSHAEVERVALIAQLHRGPLPPRDSPAIAQLASAERVELLKLAALLRVADALDADHAQRVERVRVEMTAEALEIKAETRLGDREGFAAIRGAFQRKADLCEELFGVEARLNEVLAT